MGVQDKIQIRWKHRMFKTPLVAKGCTQTEGLDYHATFASVEKLVTIHALLSLAAVKGWFLHQLMHFYMEILMKMFT